MGAADKRASYTGDSNYDEEGDNDAFCSKGHTALLTDSCPTPIVSSQGLAFRGLLGKFLPSSYGLGAQNYEDDMGQITEGTRLRRGRDGTYDAEVIMNCQVVWRQTGFPTIEAARVEANRRLTDLLGQV